MTASKRRGRGRGAPSECARYLVALRLIDHASWTRVVRAALREAKAIEGARERLGDPAWVRGHILDATPQGEPKPIGRAVLYRWLREEPMLSANIDLPGPGNLTGLPRAKKTTHKSKS